MPETTERTDGRLGAWGLIGTTALGLTGLFIAFAGVGHSAQMVLLAHVLCGLAFLPIILSYTWRHVARLWSKEGGMARNLALLGTVAVVAALLTGATLAVLFWFNVFQINWLVTLHWVFGFGVAILIPVHVLTAAAGRSAKLTTIRPVPLFVGSVAFPLVVAGLLAWWAQEPSPLVSVPKEYPRSEDGGIFSPSLVETSHGGFVTRASVTQSEKCTPCHAQIVEEWQASTHRFSGIDNELISTAVKPAEKRRDVAAARFCASCHEPVSLLTGQVVKSVFTVDEKYRKTGVTCLVCHGVQEVPGIEGNGQMVFAPPDMFPFFNRSSAVPLGLNRILLRSYPDAHRKSLRPAIMSNSHQCGSCHTVNANKGFNGFGFVRLHQENDDWSISAFSKGIGPDETIVRCQDCHMEKIEESNDAVAERNGGTHRNHRFIAANTLVAKLHGGQEQLEKTEAFLKGHHKIKELEHIIPDGPIVTMSIEAPEGLEPGNALPVTVVMANKAVGHAFPAGNTEVHETWVEVIAKDAKGRQLFASGLLDEKGHRDKDSFALIAVPVNEKGEEVFATAGLAAGFSYRNNILHDYSEQAHYFIPLPENVEGPVTLSARLRYRKADGPYIDLMETVKAADVPITDITSAQAEIKLAPEKGNAVAMAR